MRIFIDSSNPEIWQKFHRLGFVYGATTNPLILKKDGRQCTLKTYEELIDNATSIGLKELQIQATGATAEELIHSGNEIAALWGNIVVKIPLTIAGLQAANVLRRQNTRITLTAAYSTHQMIAATALGADYIAPYYGRLLEAEKDADSILQSMLNIQAASPDAPRILVASIRSIAQLEALATNGHNTFTLSPDVADQFAIDDMSITAAEEFEKAAGAYTKGS